MPLQTPLLPRELLAEHLVQRSLARRLLAQFLQRRGPVRRAVASRPGGAVGRADAPGGQRRHARGEQASASHGRCAVVRRHARSAMCDDGSAAFCNRYESKNRRRQFRAKIKIDRQLCASTKSDDYKYKYDLILYVTSYDMRGEGRLTVWLVPLFLTLSHLLAATSSPCAAPTTPRCDRLNASIRARYPAQP